MRESGITCSVDATEWCGCNGHEKPYVKPLYYPSDDGTIVLYAGDLELSTEDELWVSAGNLELSLNARPGFRARFAGCERWMQRQLFTVSDATVGLPSRGIT